MGGGSSLQHLTPGRAARPWGPILHRSSVTWSSQLQPPGGGAAPFPPCAHCSLFIPPVPLDPERVLEELKEKEDKLEQVSRSLGTAQLPRGCPPRWVAWGALCRA